MERTGHTDVPPDRRGIRRGVLLLTMLTLAAAALSGRTAEALEEPAYEVIADGGDFELRRYAAYLVAEVDVRGSFDDSGREAFRILADYIFGGNAADTRMQMTAPVESTPRPQSDESGLRFADATRGESGEWSYAFVMERRYTTDTLPEPDNGRIRIVERAERIMAVRTFSGTWSDDNVVENERALFSALDTAGIEPVGSAVFARYNAPFTPWFMRRNEVMLEIRPDSVTR